MTTLYLRKGRADIRDRAHQIIDALSDDKDWTLTVEPYKKKRTSEQNARHWKIVGEAASQIGCSPQELHEALLCEFFGYDEIVVLGRVKYRPKERSSGQNTSRFSEFDTWAESFLASEYGVFIPYKEAA